MNTGFRRRRRRERTGKEEAEEEKEVEEEEEDHYHHSGMHEHPFAIVLKPNIIRSHPAGLPKPSLATEHILQDCRNPHWQQNTSCRTAETLTGNRTHPAGLPKPSLAEEGPVDRGNNTAEQTTEHILQDY